MTTTRVLGAYSGHDAGAVLLKHGVLAVGIEKERLTREKHAFGNCRVAADYCLKAGMTSIEEVDIVATSKGTLRYADESEQQIGKLVGVRWDQVYSVDEPYRVHNIQLCGRVLPAFFVQHHIAHCASSFLLSPFNEAAILSMDGGGDFTATMFAVGRGTKLDVIARPAVKLGASYRRVAHRLGFPRLPSAPGRVMALAADGEPVYYEALLQAANGLDEFHLDSAQASALFGDRSGQDVENRDSADIAASIQLAVEEVILRLCRRLHNMTKLDSLCLAGGVALNCPANRRIMDETPFKEIFVPPICSDSGIAAGASLYVWNHVLGEPRLPPLRSASLGRDYSPSEIENTIAACSGIRAQRHEEIGGVVAEQLARGAVVGWFQGGSEVGPRALGHRSLLADPRDPRMKDHLNLTVKRRERFRPFAPAVLEERAADYFDLDRPSPFMLVTALAHESVRGEIPAVVHVDGTARVQTVSPLENRAFYDLIKAFDSLTGIPMVLNTSFNGKGMPIVESPSDAIDCFLRCPIDQLALGPYLVRRA